jgi:peptide deformylase
MAVRDVLVLPHPALKQVARELVLVEGEAGASDRELLDGLARDLLETMRAHTGCVGLAAPQLGELVRMIVVDVTSHRKTTVCHGLMVLVNPVVVRSSGAEVAREGCLSIPQLTANVRRATHIELSASTPTGEPVRVETEGFEARCLLHEIDHLDGILFLDRVDSLTTDVFRRKSYR